MVALRVFCGYWVRKGGTGGVSVLAGEAQLRAGRAASQDLTEGEMRALLGEALRECAGGSAGGAQVANLLHSSLENAVSQRGRGLLGYRALRNLALVDLLFGTEMRVGEVSALDIKDFLVEEGVFRVQGKGGRDRLCCCVMVQIFEWLGSWGITSDRSGAEGCKAQYTLPYL